MSRSGGATAVVLRDVGPRDGLQGERSVPVADRIRLVEALVEAGVRHVEVAAFVSSTAVPAMAGAVEVLAGVPRRPDVRYAVLVPNRRGAELALAERVDELTVTLSASEQYSQRNVRMSVEESLAETAAICGLAAEVSVPVDVVISCAFGSPWEGDLAPDAVAALGQRARDAGASAVTYADTTGMATPPRVADLLAHTGTDVGLHVHDTRGTALLNVYAGWQLDVRRFDTAIGGLGGSPFAADAGGNVATEEVVALFDDLGVTTGIELERLLIASALCAELVGRPVPSRVAHAGPRTRRLPA